MILLLLSLLSGPLHAAVPVLYDSGDPAAIVELLSSRTGLPTSQFEPVPLDRALASPPRTLGGAALRHCAGATTRVSDSKALLIRALAALREQDRATAIDQTDLGISGLGCLNERADLTVAARLFLLRGALLAGSQDTSQPIAEFRTALALSPSLTWDPTLPPQGQELFESARESIPLVALVISPRESASGPWIDGKDPPPDNAPLQLSPGLHLLQVPSTSGLRTAWLTLEKDATLVVPGDYRQPILARIVDPATRADLENLLLTTISPDAVYVSAAGGLYLISAEQGVAHTTVIAEPPPPPPVEETRKKKR